jgi:GDP-L-fucose synthase
MTEPKYLLEGKRVWVAGHRGMVGSAIMRRLEREPIANLIVATSSEVDLRRQAETERFVGETRPELAIIAAAKVGGINANQSAQADFLYDNLMIAANCLNASRLAGVEKVVVLGSSCIYPRDSPQPISEDYLLNGPLEATNEGYAIAKIAALELGKMQRRQYGTDVVSLMPTNLYGPEDNYDPGSSHVLPALIRKIHEAKVNGLASIELWGSGTPRREFLHVDDLADAVIHVTRSYSGEGHLNVGTGKDISIKELAELIGRIIDWDGELVLNTTMPDGTPRKLLDVSRLEALGWRPSIDLEAGIAQTYSSFLAEQVSAS